MNIRRSLSVGGALLLTGLTVATAQDSQSIFNGKDLTGWTGNPKLWSVQDGAIVGKTTASEPIKENTFLIWTNGTLEDFELTFKYKIQAGNSGVQYRSKVMDPAKWIVGGYQADFEAGKTYSGILYEERMSRGIMAARGEKVTWTRDGKKQVTGTVGKSDEIQAGIKNEEWNDYRIVAKGNHLQHFINGMQTVDVTDETEGKSAMSGVLAFQVHVGPPMVVQFKDIQLKKL